MNRLVKWFSSGPAIRLQLAAYAHFLHIYPALEKSIEHIYCAKYCRPEGVHLNRKREQEDNLNYNLPKLSSILKWYDRFSTSCLFLILAKSLLPLESWINQSSINLELPSHCYVPGRFILLVSMETYFEPLLAGALLLWRLGIMHSREFNLNLVIFLLQDESLIKRLYQQPTSEGSGWNYVEHFEPRTRYEQFLRKNLGYTLMVPLRSSIFRLRLNRKAEARTKLVAEMAKVSILTSITLVTSVSIILSMGIVQLFSDHTYLKRYPNCDRELEQLGRQGLPWYSVTLSGHKLFTLGFDLAGSGVLWFDILAATSVTLPFLYLLNYDLIYCWRAIRRQLQELNRRVRLVWLDKTNPNTVQLLSRVSDDNEPNGGDRLLEERQLSMAIFACQCEMTNFFKHCHQVDRLVSDILTASIVVAVALLSFITYSYMTKLGEVTLEARVLQLITSLLLIAMSLAVFTLQKLVAPSYLTVCSIMAYDTSCHKRRHTKILDLFAFNWTLFHSYSYRLTTLLSLIGWTFSSTTIIGNLLGRKQH